ncbi:MAG: TrkA family potassium uptake protein [Planctomycetes bacterium]|nr:TrkA family potassium uptake protein [Planctomycetota bacterium]
MNKICVIGLGRFGFALAERLAADGLEVLAIDNDQHHIEDIKDKVTLAVRADGTDIEVLRSLGVDGFDLVMVAIGDDFEASQLALMAARELGVPRIYVRANDAVKKRIVRALGAHEVIMPEEDAALRLAKNLALPSLTEAVELDRNHSLAQFSAPRKVVGQTLAELGLRQKFNLNLVAIKSRPTATMIMNRDDAESGGRPVSDAMIRIPTAETRIASGDILIIVGKDSDIDRFAREYE